MARDEAAALAAAWTPAEDETAGPETEDEAAALADELAVSAGEAPAAGGPFAPPDGQPDVAEQASSVAARAWAGPVAVVADALLAAADFPDALRPDS